MNIDLRHAIVDSPIAIEAIASSMNIKRIAYVQPGLYTNPELRSWNEKKALKNYDEINAICNGADIIVTDMEKQPRRRVRHPDEYTRKEVSWAIDDNFVPMWKWFKTNWPDAKLTEWGLSRGRDNTEFPLVDKLIVQNLDAFDISVYGKPNRPSWAEEIGDRIRYARALADRYGKLVITWIWDRYKIEHHDDTTEYRPLPAITRVQMLNSAIAEGIDIAAYWSNGYKILGAAKENQLLTESIGNGSSQSTPQINAQTTRLLAEMRLAAKSINTG